MRHTAVAAMVVLAFLRGSAHAQTYVSGEAGAERDDNVQRVETGPGLDTKRISASVLRFGARIDSKSKLLGGTFAFNVSNLTRLVSEGEASAENVASFAGNARWLHPLADRPVYAGVALSAIDAIPITDNIGARTFSNLGGDGVLAFRGGDERVLTIGFGIRDFRYKPDHDFDYWGPAANVRLDLTLWQPPSKTKSLELITTLGFENRTFGNSVALVNACPPGSPADPNCTAPTDLERRDRYQRLGTELTWVGRQVAAIGYQFTLIDSNSFGQSLARHRVTASATIALPAKLYGTLLGILQIDQYLDGLVVRRDLQQQEFTNVEDENRSSLQARLARKLSSGWSIEARAAIWRNLAGNTMELSFQRELVYLGLIYGR